jgi:hypothetical protein
MNDEISSLRKLAVEARERYERRLTSLMRLAGIEHRERMMARYLDLKRQMDEAEAALIAALGKAQPPIDPDDNPPAAA